jgi:hypothetical protein
MKILKRRYKSMKLLLAVNDESLENYIITNYRDIQVCEIVRMKKTLEDKVIEKTPDTILLSAAIIGEENIYDIITKLTSKTFKDLRIIYLYGPDDADRKNFINFLISRGIYDYCIGLELTPDIIKPLLYNPKGRENVKADILATPVPFTSDNQAEQKTKLQFFKEYMKDLTEEEKRELGLIKEDKIIEQIIYQDKIFGTITIGVAGASSGIGCTYSAVSIAKYIKMYDKKLKVALLEINDSNDFNSINIEYPSAELEGSFIFDNIDFYTSTTSLTELMSLNKYQYIVLDMGVIKHYSNGKLIIHEKYEEFVRANLSVLIVGSMSWQFKDISTCLYSDSNKVDCRESHKWKLLFNFTNDKIFRKLSKDVDWPCYNLPYCDELFEISESLSKELTVVLASILPTNKEFKNKKARLLSKR